jgi:hypothetical protein
MTEGKVQTGTCKTAAMCVYEGQIDLRAEEIIQTYSERVFRFVF